MATPFIGFEHLVCTRLPHGAVSSEYGVTRMFHVPQRREKNCDVCTLVVQLPWMPAVAPRSHFCT